MSAVYVYVLPLHGEDWLKLGISNDPLRRASEFSARFHAAFDLVQAMLVETGDRREARQIEQRFRRQLKLHRAPMPLDIRRSAGGHTEWLRGAYPALVDETANLRRQGYALHHPAVHWFGSAMDRLRPEFHSWACALLGEFLIDTTEPIEGDLPAPLRRRLEATVDTFHHFDLDLADGMPPALAPWYRRLRARVD
jgi:hypothetical protein